MEVQTINGIFDVFIEFTIIGTCTLLLMTACNHVPIYSEPSLIENDDGTIVPPPGYEWVNIVDVRDLSIVWSPGIKHPWYDNMIAGKKEGSWEPAPGFKWKGEEEQRVVVWAPGSPHPFYENVIAGHSEYTWLPADGFRWKTNEENDLRTEEIMSLQNIQTNAEIAPH